LLFCKCYYIKSRLTQLKLLTSQTTNFTFTDDELTQALQEAWNNTYVCKTLLDSTTSFTVGTFTYNIPVTLTTVTDIYYKPTSTDPMTPISSDLYTIINGQISFIDNATQWLGDTYTLYIKGRYKLLTTDSLTTDNLVNYTLSLAAYLLLKRLSYKHTFQFLKNDTSMSDIINARRDMQADMLTYKQALLREYESS
jgi:hypothetical protein